MKQKVCEYCGNNFEAVTDRAVYCGSNCRARASEKRKVSLSGDADQQIKKTSDQSERSRAHENERSSTPPNGQALLPPMKLDVYAGYIVNDLTNRNNRLENQVDKLLDEKEALLKRVISLEKECEVMQHNLEEKPRGLEGLVTNHPELIQHAAPLVQEALGLLKGLMGGPAAKEHPVSLWLKAQPEEVQNDLVEYIQLIAKNPETIGENVAALKNSVIKQQPSQPKAAVQNKVGIGFR